MSDNSRKWFKPKDIAVIFIILLLAVLMLVFIQSNNPSKTIAEISYNSEIVEKIELSTASDSVFNLNDNVSFEIKDHAIRFFNVNCHDKLCERVGFIDKPNQTAVCLPNRVVLRIVGSDTDIDAIVN